MHGYHLQDEFIDSAAEQALIAAVIHKPTLYFEFLDILAPDVFATEAATWREVALAIEADQPPLLSAPWRPSTDPQATAQRLADLYQRRLLAAAQERLAQALYDDTTPASTLAVLLEEEALRVQAALRATAFSRLQWASDLLPEVLAEAAERRRQWEETGIPVQGLSTGITHLDDLLNGLNEGLYLLGGPPGMGKTTLAWQLATHVARDTPVLFVTFEHAPTNLLLKALCARAGVNPQDVQRGQADLTLLRRAATAWQPSAQRLALIEGSSRLTVAQVRAHALQAMHRHHALRCLVVVDYLQLWAKVAEDLRSSFQVRERVELLGGALRELAMHLQSPVLALSSQNRGAGHYGNGKGSAALDSLKESGDLEYAADAVLFLIEAPERQILPPARAVDLVVAKNRQGDTGKIALIFRPDLGTLREEERR
jgi:replicative DNA helicase